MYPTKAFKRPRVEVEIDEDADVEYYSYPDDEGAEAQHAGDSVKFADIGCGYGGLMIELSPQFPEKLMLGMEIRYKVADYVDKRIKALRAAGQGYENVAVVRGNAMKYMANWFAKGQVRLNSGVRMEDPPTEY